MNLDELKAAIKSMPMEDFIELSGWLYEQDLLHAMVRMNDFDRREAFRAYMNDLDDEWDRQMAEDGKAGRLDPLIDRVEAAIREGRTYPLPGEADFDAEERQRQERRAS